MITPTGMSLPSGIIFIHKDARTDIEEFNALFIHEVFHQFQYTALGIQPTFKGLIQEMWNNDINAPQYDSYVYRDHCNPTVTDPRNIVSLQQIKTLEGQAQFIEDFVRTSYGQIPLSFNPPYQNVHANMMYSDYLRVMKNLLSKINTRLQ